MSVDACAKMVQSVDPDRFATAMCAPMPVRGDLMVLYAFNIEVARAPWVTQEEMIAEMRLQWWKDAVEEIYTGKTVRRHEVVTPLAEVVKRHDLPRGLFDDLIEARRFDIYRDGHVDRAAFDRYIAATSGNVMELAGRCLGATTPGPFQAMGYAGGVANLLRGLPALYAHGRDPLPCDAIDRNAIAEGRIDGDLRRVLALVAGDAVGQAAKARSQRGTVPRKAAPALLAAWRLTAVLKAAQTGPERVFRQDFTRRSVGQTAELLIRNTTGRW